MPALAAAGPSALWFLTRGSGAVALVLLTITVALGVLGVRRTELDGMPRFVLDGIHRNTSLLAVTFLGIHIATALLDGFVPISVLDVIVPFGSAYRPLWVGFGAVAFDLILAVAITSLMRRRLGYGAWRGTHWLAYASWPVAVVHGLGTGSDVKAHWMLLLTAACVALMLASVLARVAYGWPRRLELRVPALAAAALVPIGLIAWLPGGPLAPGWARRAGTPATLLAAGRPAAVPVSGSTGAGATGDDGAARASSPPASESAEREHSFTTRVSGTVTRSPLADGRTRVAIALTAADQPLDRLAIRIEGAALGGGGVNMSASQVTLGPGADPSQYRGHVTGLQGAAIEAHVADPGYAGFDVLARLTLPPSGSGAAAGTVTASAREGSH